MKLVSRVLTVLFLGALCGFAKFPEGIPRDLASERAARISGVRYRLAFVLTPHASTVPGRVEIRFNLRGHEAVLLDYRDGSVSALWVNGEQAPSKAMNGHLELPSSELREGANVVKIEFSSNIASAGKPITRFEDHDDHTEYIYTLFVPMDASMAFPCFDQPDLKGRFRLGVTAPEDWAVISNTAVENTSEAAPHERRTNFRETLPISTYLFAFAAGRFRKVHEAPGLPGLYVRQSKLPRAEAEAPEVQEITARSVEHLAKYFAQAFPFSKYDLVLIPGLAYAGMEHAGATFLREESVLFRAAPTHADLLGRDLLLLHETTHQWFGDLTTMRWFDDLWLKEGFAQYMAYQTLVSLKPDENIWKRFYESIKPAAYAIDSTAGTTPIYQDIPNLKDAKSAYGAIVYSKAPGVLKQLAFVLGPDKFRDGLRLYLRQHAYANAEWSDLVHAFEEVSRRPLGPWAEMWIRHRGMPQVEVAWSCDAGRITRLSLAQHDVLGARDVWPLASQVALRASTGESVRLRVELSGSRMDVAEVRGKPCPQFVFANDQDYAYGRFLLEPASRKSVMGLLGRIQDPFERTLLWGALWDAVREAELPPSEYITLAQTLLPGEADESLVQRILAHTTTALHRYVSEQTRRKLISPFETMTEDRMLHSPDKGLRITWYRGLRALAESPEGLAKLKALLGGQLVVPGVELRPLDRWNLVSTLIAHGDPEADMFFDVERQRDPSGDGRKYAYVAEAARPDSKTKLKYFDDYLHDPSRPEDWIGESLGAFNFWSQSALTEPFLKPALEALPEIKRDRKIFFLVGWLSAFVEGQRSPAAQAQVHEFLRTATLDTDLRLKILQVLDELDRTVRIRQKFPE